MGDAAARRPRRRRHQDRGPDVRRRRRPLRPAVPAGRGLALLRDVQPQQAQHLARPAHTSAGARSSSTSSRAVDVVFSNLRGDQPAQARPHLRRTSATQPADRLLLAVGLRHDRAARGGGRLRLHDAGARRLDEPHRRARRPADEERALARRPLRRLRRGDRASSRASGARAATASGCDCDISLFETALAELMYVGTWAATRGLRAARARRELRAPVDRPVPDLRDRRRLDRRRVRQGEVLAARSATRSAARTCADDPALRRLRRPRRRTATSCSRSSTRRSPSATTDAWLEALAAAGVPSGPVNDVAEALEDPQTRRARRGRRVRASAARRRSAQVATPLRVGGEAPPVAPRAVARRAHRRGPARALRLRRRAPRRPAPRGRLRPGVTIRAARRPRRGRPGPGRRRGSRAPRAAAAGGPRRRRRADRRGRGRVGRPGTPSTVCSAAAIASSAADGPLAASDPRAVDLVAPGQAGDLEVARPGEAEHRLRPRARRARSGRSSRAAPGRMSRP